MFVTGAVGGCHWWRCPGSDGKLTLEFLERQNSAGMLDGVAGNIRWSGYGYDVYD